MTDNIFIDTNIFIYALTEPKQRNARDDLLKREVALELVSKLFNENSIIISVQILNELHLNMIGKFKLDDSLVIQTLKENIFKIASVKDLTTQTYLKAYETRQKYNISYWDSLAVASALENGCTTLYTEDMQHECIIENQLKIINPFKSCLDFQE